MRAFLFLCLTISLLLAKLPPSFPIIKFIIIMGSFLCGKCRERNGPELRYDDSDEESHLMDDPRYSTTSFSVPSERSCSLPVNVTFHHYDDLYDEELTKWHWKGTDEEIECLESRRSIYE